MIRLGFKDLEYYALLRFRNEFVFSDWHPQYFLIPPLCPATIEVDTNRHARLFHFVRPLPIFHSRSIYLVPIVQKFSYNFSTRSSHLRATCSFAHLGENFWKATFRVKYTGCFSEAFSKTLLSVGTYLIQFKVEFSLAKRGIVNEHKDFFVINRGVRLVPQTNSSPTSLSRIKHFCRRILSLKRFVFFRHDRSRYFLLVHFVCPKSI